MRCGVTWGRKPSRGGDGRRLTTRWCVTSVDPCVQLLALVEYIALSATMLEHPGACGGSTRRVTMALVAEPGIDKEVQEMKRSTDRMLTTHAGSLPKPSDLDAMLRAQEAGQPYDAQALQQRLARAVAETVQQQTEHGL